VGELVVTRPMPSMPLYFWDDPDGARYREAYFSTYPGVWRHGDWVTITRHGGVVVHGRSDATMNKYGVRMGSAEVYEAVSRLPQVEDCLVVGVEEADGGYWMPLFVVLAEGLEAGPEVSALLKDTIRTQVSPRHVPDEVIVVDVLPHTMTGKRLEVPVKRLLQGARLEDAVNPTAVDAPEALPQFVTLAQQRERTRTATGPEPRS
jgi:acetoacetyl-CoA synthetase